MEARLSISRHVAVEWSREGWPGEVAGQRRGVLGWSKVDEEWVVKWGCLGGQTRGGGESKREKQQEEEEEEEVVRTARRGPRGGQGVVAVARPGSRRLLTRPVAQLDSTRLSARWQEAAAGARGGSGEGEKARGGGESVRATGVRGEEGRTDGQTDGRTRGVGARERRR